MGLVGKGVVCERWRPSRSAPATKTSRARLSRESFVVHQTLVSSRHNSGPKWAHVRVPHSHTTLCPSRSQHAPLVELYWSTFCLPNTSFCTSRYATASEKTVFRSASSVVGLHSVPRSARHLSHSPFQSTSEIVREALLSLAPMQGWTDHEMERGLGRTRLNQRNAHAPTFHQEGRWSDVQRQNPAVVPSAHSRHPFNLLFGRNAKIRLDELCLEATCWRHRADHVPDIRVEELDGEHLT